MTNTRQPILKSIPLEDFYPEDLAADLATFTEEVDALNGARKNLRVQAADLRRAALAGTLDRPEKYTTEARKLTAKSGALDIQEGRLIRQKKTFQEPIMKARAAERDRYVNMAKDRISELELALDTAKSDSRFRNGVVNGDSRVVQLQRLAGDLSGFVQTVTVEDEERIEAINVRIAATVPAV